MPTLSAYRLLTPLHYVCWCVVVLGPSNSYVNPSPIKQQDTDMTETAKRDIVRDRLNRDENFKDRSSQIESMKQKREGGSQLSSSPVSSFVDPLSLGEKLSRFLSLSLSVCMCVSLSINPTSSLSLSLSHVYSLR